MPTNHNNDSVHKHQKTRPYVVRTESIYYCGTTQLARMISSFPHHHHHPPTPSTTPPPNPLPTCPPSRFYPLPTTAPPPVPSHLHVHFKCSWCCSQRTYIRGAVSQPGLCPSAIFIQPLWSPECTNIQCSGKGPVSVPNVLIITLHICGV